MTDKTIKKLFAAARNDVGPAAPADFVADTLRLARQQAAIHQCTQTSVNGELSSLFSPISLACVSLIVLALLLDWGLTEAGFPQPGDSLSQATAQVFLTGDQM